MLTNNNGNGGYNNNNYQNNNYPNNGQQQQKEKTNFRFGRIKTVDARLDVGIWVNQYGISGKFLIRQACGKDPSTNAPIYENKAPMELPQGFLDREKMALFIKIVEDNEYQNLNFQLPGNTTISVVSEGNSIKITLTNTKTGDSRSITFEGYTNNGKVFNAQMYTLVNWLKIGYKKALTVNIEEDTGASSDDELPF